MSSMSMPLNSSKITEGSEDEEQQHYIEVLNCLKSYSRFAGRVITKYISDYDSLPQEHKDMITDYRMRLDAVSSRIPHNQTLLDEICALHPMPDAENSRVPAVLQENLKSLLRQLVRDWSHVGAAERECTYKLLLEKLNQLYVDPKGIRVLVPGAGLGRLVYELSSLGFDAQGNEFSLLMLLTSELILNYSHREKWQVFPFLFPFSNLRSQEDQCAPVMIPDIQIDCPKGNMSMTAGDFLEIYEKKEEESVWDCVTTCFFLDTAPNILKYLELIKKVLKPGGCWINLGPLLYHYEGNDSSLSIELTLEELLEAIKRLGFEIQHYSTEKCSYVQNPRSMLKTTYECSFMVMRKK